MAPFIILTAQLGGAILAEAALSYPWGRPSRRRREA